MSDAIQWEKVPSRFGVYSVSATGLVRSDRNSTNSWNGKILKPWMAGGYPMVGIWTSGKLVKTSVHRLVAETFLGKPKFGDFEVNHKNGIRSDNRVDNLEWITHAQNTIHGQKLHGMAHRKLTESQRREISALRTKKPLMGVKAIARMYGVAHVTITRIWREE